MTLAHLAGGACAGLCGAVFAYCPLRAGTTTDDPVRSHESVFRGIHMHAAAASAGTSGSFAVEFRHYVAPGNTLGDCVTMPA